MITCGLLSAYDNATGLGSDLIITMMNRRAVPLSVMPSPLKLFTEADQITEK